MGLTWIDHDTIDKPVEELSAGTAEAKDINFKVETLKCANADAATSAPHGNLNRKESILTKKVFSIKERLFHNVQNTPLPVVSRSRLESHLGYFDPTL